MNTTILRLFLSAVALTVSFVPVCAVSASGDLYVAGADFGQSAPSIFKFTPAGAKSTFVSFDLGSIPEGLAFDTAGNLFVADASNGTISKFTPAGTQSTFASGLSGPGGLAFDGAGNLFLADSGTIVKFTPAGSKSTFASGLNGSAGLAFDGSGNLFAADPATGTIFKFTPTGTKSTFASGLNDPVGLAFDGAGNLFEADNFSGTIFKFAPDGSKSAFASGLGNVHGLAFDSSGNLFVASGAILKFTSDGTKSTFASLGASSFLAFEPVTEKLRNISARGFVQTGENVLIGGFILGGNELNNSAVIIRAIGPSLSAAGITNPLQDPTLALHNASGAIIASNNNWQDTQKAQIAATGIPPSDPRESAIFATLPAGAFTAIVRGVNNTTGVALIEIYSLSK